MQTLHELTDNLRRLIAHAHANVNIGHVVLVCAQLCTIVFMSLFTPFLIRGFVSTSFVEMTEPLEFTFHTCVDQLHGVCSFPTADLLFHEHDMEFNNGYRYNFALHVDLSDLETVRALGVFIAQLEVRDDTGRAIFVTKKTLRLSGAGIYEWYIWARNWFFLPLWFVGIIGDGGVGRMTIDFPNDHRELQTRPASSLQVQLQNRFLQINTAALRIRTNTSYLSYLINSYPLTTYALMASACGCMFVTCLVIYWLKQGYHLYKYRQTEVVMHQLKYREMANKKLN